MRKTKTEEGKPQRPNGGRLAGAQDHKGRAAPVDSSFMRRCGTFLAVMVPFLSMPLV
jgi:hypothetical protein